MAASKSKSINNEPVAKLDLNRYLGSWYEIARYDHSFERGMTNTTAMYSIRPDGKIKVLNSGWQNGEYKESVGKAFRPDENVPALLRVSFFGPFYSDYRVLMLSSDYQVALVGSKNAKYLWILSRTPQLSDSVCMQVIDEARRRGYDTEKLIWVDQKVNIAGFEADE
ncbi:MAG: lipocalin family protein [Bacteroidales bacterium]|nr:lipocalin family protein [Candidatus Cacconaster merdequi]